MNRFLILIILMLFLSCQKKTQEITKSELIYSKIVQINKTKTSLEIISENQDLVTLNLNELPIKSFVIGSASLISYFKALNQESKIKGVLNPDYFYSPFIKEQIQQNKILSVGTNELLEVEKILELKPEFFITYSNPNHFKQVEILKKNGIKVLYLEDFKENSPLGKAELIKIFGKLLNTEKKANEIFKSIEENYNYWQKIANQEKEKPTIFGKIMYGDFWFMPQNKSFAAQYYFDSGGNYLWNDLKGNQSEELSFEEVLIKGKNADFWLDASDFEYKSQLIQQNKNYDLFNSFKKNQVYSLSKRKNNLGANDYYETGNLYVDSVLMDYISVLHPKLLPNYKQKFIQKLK